MGIYYKEFLAANDSLIAEFLLDNLLKQHRIKQIELEIDRALENGWKLYFMQLTTELKELKGVE